MNETLQFNAKYGILKRNIFGKTTDKIAKILDVKTIMNFTNEGIEILLYGIDRDDGTGIHNERFWFLYENISKIELLEDVNAINIVTKEGCECVDETNRKVDLAEENNVFFIDDNSVRDFTIIIKRLSTYGFSKLFQQ